MEIVAGEFSTHSANFRQHFVAWYLLRVRVLLYMGAASECGDGGGECGE
jgi:hypothetical protein